MTHSPDHRSTSWVASTGLDGRVRCEPDTHDPGDFYGHRGPLGLALPH